MTPLQKTLIYGLPYGIMVTRPDNRTFIKISGIEDDLLFLYESKNRRSFGDSTKCKPILRPLSDLTREIEYDGSYTTAIQVITCNTKQACGAYDEWVDSFIDDPNPSRLMQAPFEIFEELLRQHYNVFNISEDQYTAVTEKLNPYK